MTDEKLEKGILGTVAAGLLASAPMSPQLKAGFERAQTVPEYVEKKQGPQFDPSTLHPDMHPIAFLETSYGKNMEHAPHAKGEFDTAYGPLGFKPSTAFDEFSKNKHLLDLYPHLKDKDVFHKEFKENPKFYNLIAGTHWNRLKKATGSATGAAFAWRWGLGAFGKATPDAINNDDYVTKYGTLTQTQPWVKKLGKALTDEDHHYLIPKFGGQTEKIKSGVDYSLMDKSPHAENESHFNQHVLKNPRLIKPIWKNQQREEDFINPHSVNGGAPKMIFGTPEKKWMVKPFYDDDRFNVVKDEKGKPVIDPSYHGWNEHASQDIYHAAGLGDLVQKSHHAKHSRVGLDSHLTVIEMDPDVHDFEKYLVTEDEFGQLLPRAKVHPSLHNTGIKQQAQKFAFLDWVTGNVDRHVQNLMVKHPHKAAGKAPDSLFSIDHGYAFQYGHKKDPNDLGGFLKHSPLLSLSSVSKSGWLPTFEWWEKVSPAVEQAFLKNLNSIRDLDKRKHLLEHFNKKKQHLDRLAQWAKTSPGDDRNEFLSQKVV